MLVTLSRQKKILAFHAKQNFDNFRLVTYRGNDVSFIGDIKQQRGEILIYIMNESRSFELDKSKHIL